MERTHWSRSHPGQATNRRQLGSRRHRRRRPGYAHGLLPFQRGGSAPAADLGRRLEWRGQAPGKPLGRLARAGLLAQHQLLCGCRLLRTTPPVMDLCRHQSDCQTIWKAPPLDAAITAPLAVEWKAADGVTTLYGQLVLPPGKTAPASVPLILNPYGGPHAQDGCGAVVGPRPYL